MLKISKLTDYGTVVMSYLALEPNSIVSASKIAKDVHLNIPTVSKLLKILSEARLVKSYRGTGGGYKLARGIQDITVADVVVAIEGKLAMTECAGETSICTRTTLCAIKENWQIINKVILNALTGVTLEDMIRNLSGHPFKLQNNPIKVEGF